MTYYAARPVCGKCGRPIARLLRVEDTPDVMCQCAGAPPRRCAQQYAYRCRIRLLLPAFDPDPLWKRALAAREEERSRAHAC